MSFLSFRGANEVREPGIHKPGISIDTETGVLDSGSRFARPQ